MLHKTSILQTTKNNWLLLVPLFMVIVSSLLWIIAYNVILKDSANRFKQEFLIQNRNEIAKGDLFTVSERIGGLISGLNVQCLTGKRGQQVFLQINENECQKLPWTYPVKIFSKNDESFNLTFLYRLPKSFERLAALWLLAQAALVLAIYFGSRQSERYLNKERTKTLEAESALGKLAAQVAHDIRSPLASLMVASDISKGLSEQDRSLIRNAVNRIRDIANNLLSNNRGVMTKSFHKTTESNFVVLPLNSLSPELITEEIESALSLKRTQYLERSDVNFEIELKKIYGVFIKINPTEFSRLLSNLINNSVEAFENGGLIRITCNLHKNNHIELKISDNGKGIPDTLLKQLGTRGKTHGKVNGSGLGLFHAMSTIKSWGGNLVIESQFGKGTIITLQIPITHTPAWFLEEIKIVPNLQIIILDDDPTIHEVWDFRFADILAKYQGTQLFHFYSVQEVLKWYRENVGGEYPTLYLSDYELAHDTQTGLDIIDMLGIESQSVLVTSHADEATVREICLKRGIKLLPKSLAAIVPIC